MSLDLVARLVSWRVLNPLPVGRVFYKACGLDETGFPIEVTA